MKLSLKNRLRIYISMAAFLLISACASQNKDGSEEVTAENDASLGDVVGLESAPSDGATETLDGEKTASNEKNELKDDELGNLDSLGLDEKPKEETAPSDDLAAVAPPPPPQVDIPADGALPETIPPTASNTPPVEGALTTPDSSTLALPPVAEDVPKPKKRHTRKAAHASAPKGLVPKIPASAIRKGNALLNRFYFLRAGDTPEGVSALLYGNAAHKEDLVAWNSGAWKAGTLVYYNSPMQAGDQEMRSFYQERSVPPEEYEVKKGETLQKVAGKKFGSKLSWVEIAVINGLDKPSVAPGQKIALYPLDLSKFAYVDPATQVAANTPKVEPPPTAEAPVVEPPKPVEPPVEQKKKEGFDLLKFVQQEMSFIIMGGGVLVLLVLLALIASKKRRARNLEDISGDDADGLKRNRR